MSGATVTVTEGEQAPDMPAEVAAAVEGAAEASAEASVAVAEVQAGRDIAIAEIQAEVAQTAITAEAERTAAIEGQEAWRPNFEALTELLNNQAAEIQSIRAQLETKADRPNPNPEQGVGEVTPDSQEAPEPPKRKKKVHNWI
jgi:hypothetical protein